MYFAFTVFHLRIAFCLLAFGDALSSIVFIAELLSKHHFTLSPLLWRVIRNSAESQQEEAALQPYVSDTVYENGCFEIYRLKHGDGRGMMVSNAVCYSECTKFDRTGCVGAGLQRFISFPPPLANICIVA